MYFFGICFILYALWNLPSFWQTPVAEGLNCPQFSDSFVFSSVCICTDLQKGGGGVLFPHCCEVRVAGGC